MRRKDFRHVERDIEVLMNERDSPLTIERRESPYKSKLLTIRSRVKNIEEISSHQYLYINLFLFCGELIFQPIYKGKKDGLYPFQDIHLMIQNHPEYFRNPTIDAEILKRAMFLLAPSYGRASINALWKTYINDVPPSLRMYDVLVDENEVEWVVDNPSAVNEMSRDKELFLNLLQDDSMLQLIANDIPFISLENQDNEVRFTLKNEFGEPDQIEFIQKMNEFYPKWMFKMDHPFIMTEHIREVALSKKGLQDLNTVINLEKTAKDLTMQSGDEKWIQVYSALRLDKIDYDARHVFSTKFYLQSITHILGKLGSGKSFIAKILAKNLVNHGKRLLILENDVAKSLKLMKELKEIGIKAAVFLGESELERHRNNFESSHLHAYSNIFTYYEENSDELGILSNNNYTEMVIGQTLPSFKMSKNQTIQLNGEKGKRIAPDYCYNDIYKKYEMLIEADVWIGNYEAFLMTKAPYYVDRFERNFLLLGWLRSDLIIADEYDQVQLRFDNHFVQTIKLVTNNNNRNENFLDYMYSLLPEIQKSKVKGFLEAYTNGISMSQKLGYYLYSSIFSEQMISGELKNKSFTKEKLFFEFVKHFIKEKFNKIDAFNDLKRNLIESINTVKLSPNNSRLENLLVTLRQYYTGQMFSEPISSREKLEIRDELIVEMLGELKRLYKLSYTNRAYSDRNYTKEIIVRMDLLLSFAVFDYHNRYLLNEYKTFMMFWDQENKEILKPDNPFIKPMREAYVPAPLLGDLVSYRFSDQDDKNGRLELHYYTGVGRDLLARLPDTFEFIEPVQKPAVLFLSATSYNPGSSAYHTSVRPQWLLSNSAQVEQKIHLSYLPRKDEENEFKPIIVSGLPTTLHKEKALHKLVKMFVEDGHFEKNFLRMQEEYDFLCKEETMDEYLKGKRRIIAAPVFSFELAEILGNILKEETNYKVFVQFENNKFCKGVPIEYDPARHVTKNDIENIYEKDVDILVFVANSVGRGLNILQGGKSRNSLIGTMYFFIRPYPQPDDFNELLHQLHSSFGSFLIEADSQVDSEEPLFKYWNKVQGKLNGLYTHLINRRPFWNSLSEANKKVLTLNMMTLMYQTMGRGLRGNTNLTVYLVDAAFAWNTAEAANNSMSSVEPNEESYKDSLLGMMEHLLWNRSDFLLDIVFEPLKQALKGIALKPKEEVVSADQG